MLPTSTKAGPADTIQLRALRRASSDGGADGSPHDHESRRGHAAGGGGGGSSNSSRPRHWSPGAAVAVACLLTLLSVLAWDSTRPAGEDTSELRAELSRSAARQQALAHQLTTLAKNQQAMLASLSALSSVPGAKGQQPEQQQQPPTEDGGDDDERQRPLAALPALTALHNAALRSSKDYEKHRGTLRRLLDRLAHMEPAAAAAEVQAQLGGGGGGGVVGEETDPVALFGLRLYALLLSTGRLFPCREDATLVAGDDSLAPPPRGAPSGAWGAPRATGGGKGNSSSGGGGGGSGGGGKGNSSSSGKEGTPRYYFAANLRDNGVQMPRFVLSLLQTLLALPRGAAFVSVYESNSDDGAHGWVDVLQLALGVVGTPARLVARGMLVRTEGQHRIEFLAQVRNMALAPLYAHYAATAAAAAAASPGPPAAAGAREGKGGAEAGGRAPPAPAPPGALPWSPDFVVFVNDVFFCPAMALRLMNYRADITCGTDWWQNQDATVALPEELKAKGSRPKPQIPAAYRLEAPLPDALGPDQLNPVVFYDIWVARDISGAKLWWAHPFVQDDKSQQAMRQGLPVRASCCWNGLVVLRAAPFAAGVRFRARLGGECDASECSLMCEDFARLGYDRVVIDAGVQVAYDWGLAREMAALGVEGVGQSTWEQVLRAGVSQAGRAPALGDMEQCCLQPRSKWINFYQDCRRANVLETNYTQRALEMSATEQPWARRRRRR